MSGVELGQAQEVEMDRALGLERADVSDKSGNVHRSRPNKFSVRLAKSRCFEGFGRPSGISGRHHLGDMTHLAAGPGHTLAIEVDGRPGHASHSS